MSVARRSHRPPGRASMHRAMEDPMPIGPARPGGAPRAAIPLSEIVLRAMRSSGPGGQHANVTASRIEASFEVLASESLTDEQKHLICTKLGPRVVAVSQDSRGQARNRELALQRLQRRLANALVTAAPRIGTRPSRAAKARRVDRKRQRSELKRGRRRAHGDDD